MVSVSVLGITCLGHVVWRGFSLVALEPSPGLGGTLGRSLMGCSPSLPFLQRWSMRGIVLTATRGEIPGLGMAVVVLEAGQLLGGLWLGQRNRVLGTPGSAAKAEPLALAGLSSPCCPHLLLVCVGYQPLQHVLLAPGVLQELHAPSATA